MAILSPSDFLTLLWGSPPPGQVLVWTLPKKHSTWFQNYNNINGFCATHAEDDVYTGVSIVARDARVTRVTRTSNLNAAGIAGLWADIDIANPVHKKAALPQSIEEALRLVRAPPPTVLIHSGHGLQAWWLFQEGCWMFENTQQRLQAQGLVQWWNDKLKQRAAALGWAWDATWDLARVMRMPGTVNNKADPVPVQIIAPIGERIQLASLLANLPAVRVRSLPLTSNGHHLVLNPDAAPNQAKFEALQAASIKFQRSWAHQRRDMKDQSASSYDMSLATIAAQAEWSDQEIADLLIAHRREHGEDLKLREDYYQRTIDRARAPGATTATLGELEQAADDSSSVLELVSNLLGIEIEAMLRYDTHPVTFGALVAGREIRLGEAEGINSQVKFRNKMAGATLKNINILSKSAWDMVSQSLLEICETVDLGEETRPADELWHLLLDYLAEWKPIADMEEAAQKKHPFLIAIAAGEESETIINLPNFMDHLVGSLHRNFKRADVTIWLRSLGAAPRRMVIANYGQYNGWALPMEISETSSVVAGGEQDD